MKKVSLLFAIMVFACVNTFAQFSYDFTGCPEGAKVAQTLGLPWTTWSDAPGGAEDGVFATVDGNMAAYFTYGVDQVVALGELTTGVYDIEFDVYIEENYMGYFNIMHHHPCNSDQAIQVYLQATNTGQSGDPTTIADGHGSVHAGGAAVCDLPCRWNDWMHFRIHVDLDTDVAEIYFDGALMHTWQWSLDSFASSGYSDRTLGGIDFFPPGNASNSRYYVDNVVFTPQGGEQELIGESFEEYTVGNKIAAEAVAAGHDWWTTWSNQPGGSNDGTVSNDYASEGNNSGYFTNASDQVLLLGDYETGVYDLSFDVYTPAGKDGYFNILHAFPASGNGDWAMQAYFNAESDETNNEMWHSTGHGSVHAGGALVADLPCVEDEWMNVRVHIDCDTDEATLFFNDQEMYTWQWSLGSFGDESTRVIAGANFFGPLATSQFYVDNIHFTRIGGESAPSMVVSSDAIYQELDPDEVTTQTFVISNEGTSIGDWSGYVDFGHGEGGTQQQEIYYDNGEATNLTGLQTANFIEVANKFPVTSYGGAVMGTKLKSVKYFVATDSNGVLGFTGDLYLRAYKAGASGNPGELLGEVVIPANQIVQNDWNTGTFAEDIWLTGYDVFVSAAFQQIDGGYPVVFDNAAMVPGVRYLQIGGGGTWYLVDDIWDSNNNFCLHAVCEGAPIPGGWVTMDKNYGSLLGGTEEEITFTFNTIGMSNGEEYNANLLITTNDVENPEFNIPVTLKVGIDGVEETANQLASIYPNPATSQVTLEGENLNSVAIYNVAGQLVRVVKLGNVVNNIEMNVEAGVYFFSVYDNNGRNRVQRVVIVK